MKILLAYGTTEGQTRKIIKAAAAQISELGHRIELFDTSTTLGEVRVASFDKIIVAGSVHDQRHQSAVELFVTTHLDDLRAKQTLFISVSLAAAFEEGAEKAQDYVDEFIKNTAWRPHRSATMAGSVRHGEYGYFEEQILKHIVLKDRPVEELEGDHEYTDWNALAKVVEEFVADQA
jgi:menaquinone-dependent protoporphyrinogen oxidase